MITISRNDVMRAAVLNDTASFSIDEVEVPEPADGEVLVRVHYTGICGSDVPRALYGRVHSFPLILGHEFSGVVEKVGSSCDKSLFGKRVAGIPLVPCGECESCRKGYYSLCDDYCFIGSRQPGSMAEYVCVPQNNVFVIPDEVSDLEAAFFEPTTVALHAVYLSGFSAGSSVLLFGAGTIGILLAQALVALGAERVTLCNRSESRLDHASNMPGINLVCTEDEDWLVRARALSNDGYGFIFDTVACSATISNAAKLACDRGVVCFVGTPKRDLSFAFGDWELINRKELTYIGSWMSYSDPWPGEEWETAKDLFRKGAIKISSGMVDTIYPLCQVQEAFNRFKVDGGVTGKLLIDSWKV